jgi:glutamate-1-semialdehyde 2,1-aminomutase
MGVVPPAAGYLAGLRSLCDRYGALLLFDEVMTGFRVAWGGAQVRYDVRPDVTCLGKVIGGGLPVGAYGGSRQLMERISPAGPVYQAGTLSGNPVAMSAGIATLEILQEPATYGALETSAAALAEGLVRVAAEAGVPVAVNRVGSMVGLFFVRNHGDPVTNYSQATGGDTAAYARFFHAMLDHGVYLAPSRFEVMFVGTAHTLDLIDRTIKAAAAAMAVVAGSVEDLR